MKQDRFLNRVVFVKSGEKFVVVDSNGLGDVRDVNVLLNNGKTFNLYASYIVGYLKFEDEELNKEFDEYISKYKEEEKERKEKKEEIKKEVALREKRKLEEASKNRIDKFREEYRLLSNFYPCDIEYKGITYKNNEAAFQAQKDPRRCKEFASLNPSAAKKLGRSVALRKDWGEVKISIMADLLRCKFDQNPSLKELLLQTGKKQLMEGNTWNDMFWGVSCKTGKGRNVLGILLMKLRETYRKEGDGKSL